MGGVYMTKRQFAIIFTLMALIVCVGVLASKLNKDGFNDPGDLGAVLQQNDDKTTDEDKETVHEPCAQLGFLV